DFLAFWSGAHLALTGDPAAAYDLGRMIEAHQVAVPGSDVRLPWLYPPTYQLLVLPLALIGYYPALLLWSLGGLAAYAAVIRRFVREPGAIWPILAFPAVVL